MAGRSGAGPITHFDHTQFKTHFACEVKNWDATAWFEKRELRHADLFLQYGVGAAMMAMKDAGYDGLRVPEGEEDRWGTYIGSGLGGLQTIEDGYKDTAVKGPRYGLSPYFVADLIINMVPGVVSIRTGARGPNFSHVSACSSSAHSVGEAARLIRWGESDVMIAGGTESTITILGVGGFNSMRALSTRNESP